MWNRAWWLTCRQSQTSRKIWIYDTFEGLPAPTPEDPDFDLAKSREGDYRETLMKCGNCLTKERYRWT